MDGDKNLMAQKENNSFTSSDGIFRNMLLLASGSSIGKLIMLISMPILTRIYEPNELGVLSVFSSITLLLLPMGTMLFTNAVMLPKNHGLAMNLAVAVIVMLSVVCVILLFVLFFFSEMLFNLFSINELLPFWWLISVSILFMGLYEVFSSWNMRLNNFKSVSISKIAQAFVGEPAKLVLGLVGFKAMGLIVGYIVANIAGVLIFFFQFMESYSKYKNRISISRVRLLLSYYIDFAAFRLPSQFLLIFSIQAPMLFSAWIYGNDITGQIALAFMALALPVSLVGHTTGQAYYAEISKQGRHKAANILVLTKDVTRKLFVVGLVPAFILITFGKQLFTFVFGEEWRLAGTFAGMLAIYLLAQFVSAPVVHVFSLFNRQIEYLRVNIKRSILVVVIFAAGKIQGYSPDVVIFCYSIILAVYYLFVVKRVFRVINENIA